VSEKSDSEEIEPLALSPRGTAISLNCSIDRVYQLIRAGELDAYKDGRSTKITMASIKARQARLLAMPYRPDAIAPNNLKAAHTPAPTPAPVKRPRGRPRKTPPAPAAA
jgi:excisionase family DNA binding protein